MTPISLDKYTRKSSSGLHRLDFFQMKWQDYITLDPDILVGKPVIKGTRLAVDFIIELLAQGWPEAEILRNYPGLKQEDIRAGLLYASEIMRFY